MLLKENSNPLKIFIYSICFDHKVKFIPIPFDYGYDCLYGRFDSDFDDRPLIEDMEKGNRLALYTSNLVNAQAVLDCRDFLFRFPYFAQMNDAGISYPKMRDEVHRITLGQFEDEMQDAGILRRGYRLPESVNEPPLDEITQNTLRTAYFGGDVQHLVDAHFSLAAYSMLMRFEGELNIDGPVILGGNTGPSQKSTAQVRLVRH